MRQLIINSKNIFFLCIVITLMNVAGCSNKNENKKVENIETESNYGLLDTNKLFEYCIKNNLYSKKNNTATFIINENVCSKCLPAVREFITNNISNIHSIVYNSPLGPNGYQMKKISELVEGADIIHDSLNIFNNSVLNTYLPVLIISDTTGKPLFVSQYSFENYKTVNSEANKFLNLNK